MPLNHAAEANGVGERTVHEWIERGRDGEEPYAAFSASLTRAKSVAVKNLHVRALAGGKGSNTATWFLERRFRGDYGPTQRLEHSGPDGGAIQITAKPASEMTDAELESALKRLRDTNRILPS